MDDYKLHISCTHLLLIKQPLLKVLAICMFLCILHRNAADVLRVLALHILEVGKSLLTTALSNMLLNNSLCLSLYVNTGSTVVNGRGIFLALL